MNNKTKSKKLIIPVLGWGTIIITIKPKRKSRITIETLRKPKLKYVEIEIVGTSPLICARWTQKAIQMIQNQQ